MQDPIISLFKLKSNLSDDESQILLSFWTTSIHLKRNDFLVKSDAKENYLYFIKTGTLRVYYPNKEQEISVGFAYDNTFICSFPSFVKDKPSEYFIQALSKCELLAIKRNDFYKLVNNYPAIERAWRCFVEDALVGIIEREVEILTLTPEERYDKLLQRSPHIFQKVPQKYIASYLNMQPETLSRRKHQSKKH
ncbi:MAG TPA: Crp/Fnr family transcriptional regulator [Chitinophagales bacterium]|jgi:CRP-like cAMP-binding protein|nr:Crp/Fnr family transcriptional regulator [Chitinophagales bacterium]HPN19002.1 Crp/Fnr family transcriptional regulator [Chitinophagales bacterium]